MKKTDIKHITAADSKPKTRCLSCGTSENMLRRKYCSTDCRQRLRHQLNIRTGLLKALNTRYATFYFTDSVIVMDVLPHGADGIFSYIYKRSSHAKPADDFIKMAYKLGDTWWAERRRTQKRYRATLQVLEQADRNDTPPETIKPMKIKQPANIGKSLIHLKLSRSELASPRLQLIIKNAFRAQAKQHHPDHGGDAATFRKIHQAYLEMIHWAENPTFINRHGFPDRWFYSGKNNRWVQPTPFSTDYRKPQHAQGRR